MEINAEVTFIPTSKFWGRKGVYIGSYTSTLVKVRLDDGRVVYVNPSSLTTTFPQVDNRSDKEKIRSDLESLMKK